MADGKKRAPQDIMLIRLEENYEVTYWTREFGVTRHRLEQAVKAVVPSLEESARCHLARKPATVFSTRFRQPCSRAYGRIWSRVNCLSARGIHIPGDTAA
jgi:hypothetical protein